MKTYIYMVRHGESPKSEGNERTRGLTEKGRLDTDKVTKLLLHEGIDVLVSSPYRRAVLTIEKLAQAIGKEIFVLEDLKELIFSREEQIVADKELYPYVRQLFADPHYSLPGGETLANGEERAVARLKDLVKTHEGKKVVIGTHGLIMTLMLGYFDRQYGLDFLFQTSKPDVYRMEFAGEAFVETKRLWGLEERNEGHG